MKFTLQELSLPLLFTFVLAFSLNSTAFAVNDPIEKDEDVVSYTQMFESDDDAVESVDAKLTQIESILDENSNLNYDQFVSEHSELANEASLEESELVNSLKASDAPLGINGFFWGFCLGAIGILIVFLIMEDSPARTKQTKNALWGCVALGALWVLYYVVVILLVGGSYWWVW